MVVWLAIGGSQSSAPSRAELIFCGREVAQNTWGFVCRVGSFTFLGKKQSQPSVSHLNRNVRGNLTLPRTFLWGSLAKLWFSSQAMQADPAPPGGASANQ
eukprot:g35141.t1